MNRFVITALLVTLAAVAAIAQGPPMDPAMLKEIMANVEACKASENPPQADMDLYKAHQQPTTQQGKCFAGCMMEKCGLIVNGAYSRVNADEKARKMLSNNPTLLDAILKDNANCEQVVGTTGTDKCVTGPKLMDCMVTYNKMM